MSKAFRMLQQMLFHVWKKILYNKTSIHWSISKRWQQLFQVQSSSSSLTLEAIPLVMSDTKILCDTSTGVPHSFIPLKFRCTMFDFLHSLSLILEYEPLNTSSLLCLFGLALTQLLGGRLSPDCHVNVPRYNDTLLLHSPHLQILVLVLTRPISI